MKPQNSRIENFQAAVEFFNSFSNIGIEILKEGSPLSAVRFGNHMITLPTPSVLKQGDHELLGQVLETGKVKGNGKRTRRLFNIHLSHKNLAKIRWNSSTDTIHRLLDDSGWIITDFWFNWVKELHRLSKKLEAMSNNPTRAMAQSQLGEVSKFVNSIPLLDGESYRQIHGTTIDLSDYKTVPQTVMQVVRDRFLEAAEEMGCVLPLTSKGDPGEKVIWSPVGYSKPLAKLVIWPDFGCSQRWMREMFSSAAHAVSLENNSYSKPQVVSELGEATFLMKENKVKFVPCAVADVEALQAQGNVDMILGTGFTQASGALNSKQFFSKSFPYNGETEEEAKILYGKKLEDCNVVLEMTPRGSFFEPNWLVSGYVVQDTNMVYKICNVDGVKGMVTPESILLVEQRPNETFFRPVFYVLPEESIIKKQAQRTLLHMLVSQLPEEDRLSVLLEERENYTQVMTNTLSKLGHEGKSQLFILHRGVGDKSKEHQVLGFDNTGFISEEVMGSIDGTLEFLCEAVCGTIPILRLNEDEEYGKSIRLPEHGNSIRLDPFLVMGKNVQLIQENEKTKDVVDFIQDFYHILENL